MRRRNGDSLIFIAVFIVPAMIALLLFWIVPIVCTVFLSFTDWDYMTPDFNLVGIENYKTILKDGEFWNACKNTLLFTLGTAVPSVLIGGLLAVSVHGIGRGGGLYKWLLFSPWVTPAVAVSIVWAWIYEPDAGIANQIFQWLGMRGLPWLHSSSTALVSVMIVTVWKNLGYVMILFLAALSKVPQVLYDAAAVDGAGDLRRFWSVTVPMVSPTTCLIGILMAVQSIQAYDQIQVLTQGGPAGSTRTILYLYYQLAFEQFCMGEAAAAVVILVGLSLCMAAFHRKIGKQTVNYELS